MHPVSSKGKKQMRSIHSVTKCKDFPTNHPVQETASSFSFALLFILFFFIRCYCCFVFLPYKVSRILKIWISQPRKKVHRPAVVQKSLAFFTLLYLINKYSLQYETKLSTFRYTLPRFFHSMILYPVSLSGPFPFIFV